MGPVATVGRTDGPPDNHPRYKGGGTKSYLRKWARREKDDSEFIRLFAVLTLSPILLPRALFFQTHCWFFGHSTWTSICRFYITHSETVLPSHLSLRDFNSSEKPW